MNASTFTARVVASTGADCAAALSAAVGALSGPLHGGAPSRVLKMLDEVEETGDAEQVGQRRARPRRSPDGLRAPHLPRRRPPRPRAAAHLPRTRLAPLRGRRGAREGRARGAPGPPARPRAGHQRGVLVGRDPRPRRSAAGPVHADVHLRPRGRLVGAHPRAEARGQADPPDREVRRRRGRARSRTSKARPRQAAPGRPISHRAVRGGDTTTKGPARCRALLLRKTRAEAAMAPARARRYIIPLMSGMPPPPAPCLPSRAPRRRSPRW